MCFTWGLAIWPIGNCRAAVGDALSGDCRGMFPVGFAIRCRVGACRALWNAVGQAALSGVGQAAGVSGKQLCRAYMVCVALERKHVENMQKPFCSESMPVGQLSACRGRNAVGAYSSPSGFARCRVCRGKVAVGPAFQTLSGMVPCLGSVGDRGLSGSCASGGLRKRPHLN